MNGKHYGIGQFELLSLAALRERAHTADRGAGRLKVSVVQGDVRRMHQWPEFGGALFQVASQFNMLEMVGPAVTPEDGVTRYENDHTQGPACAIAAGAATIYRNYFVPVGGQNGQTSERQLDGLADLGAALSEQPGRPVGKLWSMQNGYVLCSYAGLDAVTQHLASLGPNEIDVLRGKLLVGLHRDVEVIDAESSTRPIVSQVFCSALPVAYGREPRERWQSFASLILEAAYEATIWAAVDNVQRRRASNVVLLTRLGGGAFGNEDAWIDAAMCRSLGLAAGYGLDIRLVSYGPPSPQLLQIAQAFA
ncbi:hypothetical protein [Azoarcus sp. KH32C]|uniref:hypothetical protein n=1 Tax=Azoarcus sp. KH32C TaxID=748247 RepID=UPI0002385EAD|nr:hypothetical protein [Azoarcus sp. KH32C]BAL23472.1 hypothetical protein AZKH_1143 [Azoarcus sp. KH32C]